MFFILITISFMVCIKKPETVLLKSFIPTN
jgi:hypothetical protein